MLQYSIIQEALRRTVNSPGWSVYPPHPEKHSRE